MRPSTRQLVHFGERIFVSLHAFIILLATAAAGLLLSKILYSFGMHSLLQRSVLATVLSYAVFFLLIRIWLSYVAYRVGHEADALDFDSNRQGARRNPFDWLDIPYDIPSAVDAEGCLFFLALLLVIGALLVGLIFLIAEAPLILTDAAFEFLLSCSLIRSLKRIESPDWCGSVLKASWKPFFVILLITVVATAIIQVKCPRAERLRDAWSVDGC